MIKQFAIAFRCVLALALIVSLLICPYNIASAVTINEKIATVSKMLQEKQDEVSKLESEKKNVNGYAILGNDTPPSLLTGDYLLDQIFDYSSRIKVLKEQTSFLERYLDALSSHVIADSDGDGVPDDEDECSDTPPGTKVDEYGCPVDVWSSVCGEFKSAEFTIEDTEPQEIRITSPADNFAIVKEDGEIVYQVIAGKSSGSLTLMPGTYILYCSGGGAMGLLSATVCIEYPVIKTSTGEPQKLKISGLQLGPEDGKDVHVYSYTYRNWDNANWGAYPVLEVGYEGIHLGVDCIDRTYIEFDLSSLPSDREIANATLSLYCFNQEGEGAEYAVYRVTEPWAEGEGAYHSGEVEPTAQEPWITWNRQPTFDSTQAFATEFIAQRSAPQWISLDVTELVENWYDGSLPNYGIVLRLVEENGSAKVLYFHSSESEEAELRPKLVVTFSGEEYECPQDAGEAYQWYIAAYNKLTSLTAEGKGDTPEALEAYAEYKAAKACYESRISGTEP